MLASRRTSPTAFLTPCRSRQSSCPTSLTLRSNEKSHINKKGMVVLSTHEKGEVLNIKNKKELIIV